MSKIIESLRSKGFNADEVVEAIESLEARVAELKAELLEQCRVNGAGSEREAKLMTRVAQLENPEPCVWVRDEDMHGTKYWNQSCGDYPFVFANGGPAQNKFQFCPNCGRPLEVSDE